MLKRIILCIFILLFFGIINAQAEANGADMSINNDYNTTRKLTYTFGASHYGLYKAYLRFNEVYIGNDNVVYYVDNPNTSEHEGSNFVVYYLNIPYDQDRVYDTRTVTKDPYNPSDFPQLKKDTNYKITMCVEKGSGKYIECSDHEFWINVTDKNGSYTECREIGRPNTAAEILRCYAAGCYISNSGSKRSCLNRTTDISNDPLPGTQITGDDDCAGIYGKFLDDLKAGLKAFKIIAPIMVAVYTTVEYLNAVTSKDADALKKANNRLISRFILLLILFFLPDLVNIVLKLVGVESTSNCLK